MFSGWHWSEVGSYFTLTSFIILMALITIGYHHAPLLSEWLPESCVLIILGIGVGFFLSLVGWLPQDMNENQLCTTASSGPLYNLPSFTPELFFFVLLPPVILESAYSLYDVDFMSNLGTVLLYAVVGTLLNTFAIGPLLYFLSYVGLMGKSSLMPSQPGYQLDVMDSLIFSALISAVDPVAVLAIFQETHIDRSLYFLVFGESLFNDAVTVGLYHTMLEIDKEIALPGVGGVILAGLDLILVGVAGLLIGVTFGLFTALLTKTTGQVRVLEPLLLLGLAYMSYLSAELLEFSGVISIIGCGLVQAHYAMKNISHKSKTTVKYFTKMQSAISEAIIFLFLGMALVKGAREFHFTFILWTLVLCLICRFMGVFLLTAVANHYRVRKVSYEEQFIMAYGGLRGAVCFSLVHMLDSAVVPAKNLFQTTSLAVILFTVFVQGTTIKPLMKIFHIKEMTEGHARHDYMIQDIHDNVGALMLAGLEAVTGVKGHFSLLSKVRGWDEKYFQRWFLSPDFEPSVLRAFRRHAIYKLYDESGHRETEPVVRVELRDTKETTAKDRKELRRILGTTRPMSLMRHHIDDEESGVHEELAAARLRRQQQIQPNPRRLHEVLHRNSQFQDNNRM